MAPSSDPLVWVDQGTTQHAAFLLGYEGAWAVVKWASTDGVSKVAPVLIKKELPSRRRKNNKAEDENQHSKKIKTEEPLPDDDAVKSLQVAPDTPVSSSTAANVPSATVTPDPSASEESDGSETPIKKESDASDKDTTKEESKPESEYARIVRVKKEEVNHVYSGQASKESAELKARQQKMEDSLTDPKTENPRVVFRRGCSKNSSVTTVLGGCGASACPIVRNPPGGEANKYIKEGDRYIAAHCDWNTWAPRFPGDNGMVDVHFISEEQREYHHFTSCSTRHGNPHYHGPEATGKYLYLGVYEVPEKGSDDAIVQSVHFKDLPTRLQQFRAEWYQKHNPVSWKDPIKKDDKHKPVKHSVTEDDITEEHYDQALQEYRDEVNGTAGEEWEDMTDAKRAKAGSLEEYKEIKLAAADEKWTSKKATVAAWVVMLCEKNYVIDLLPVKFVSYDEDLYQELVAIGAANGQVTHGANPV